MHTFQRKSPHLWRGDWMKKNSFYRTDLLVEDEEVVRHKTGNEKETLKESKGITFDETRKGRLIITDVKVDERGEKRIGKKKGHYVTLTVPTLSPADDEEFLSLSKTLTDKLEEILKNKINPEESKVLFVGLGNREITPDAIGPLTIDRLQNLVPDYYAPEGSHMFVYAPGVTIQTGLETADFVKAITAEVKPDVLVVIDALAARDSSRLCKTVQLTDTGIHPGSGVGNSRKEISEETLGIPVIAIGIPTVVDGPVLIADAIETMFSYLASKIEEQNSPSSALSVSGWLHSNNDEADRSSLLPIFGEWSSWAHEDRIQLFEEVLVNRELNTFVSPKEIDSWVTLYADMLANTIADWMIKMKK